MKKYLFIPVVLLFSTVMIAQGIAVQGIARDNALSAIADQTLTFTFNITKSDNTVLYSETQGIRTDNFGVFSHVVSTGNPSGNSFSSVDFQTEGLKLKVFVNYNSSDIEVYDQPFYYTPYAHFAKKAEIATNADDGVPTGSIMPYIGTTAPTGWVLCDGQNISSITGSEALISLLGENNVPDLQGMFLRGAGANEQGGVYDAHIGPDLKEFQLDGFKSHLHNVSLNTNTTGNHNHSYTKRALLRDASGGGRNNYWASDATAGTSYAGNHAHTVNGNTGSTGITETRPVNYGVNYIIKL
jgi:microcystin-dependent protein